MQFIRPHQILRPLGDHSVHRRQKLRAHRRVKHVPQHIFQRFIVTGVRIILHQMPHQGLGHACVHPVHGHVIPIVGSPAKGQLRHVPGSDHKTSLAVCNVHQHLGPLPGLAVLVGHVMVGHVLADVPKMHRHRLFDVHLLQRGPQSPRQQAGVLIGPVRSAEAGHCHRQDALSVQTQQIKGAHGDKQRQRGIQPAGNAQHRCLQPRMLVPLFQAIGLDGKNLLTAPLSLLRVSRHERQGRKPALQIRLRHLQPERHFHISGIRFLAESPHAPPVRQELPDINVPIESLTGELLHLRQNRTVLRNQVVPAEHQVLGGLPLPCGGVYIAAKQPCAYGFHQKFPVLVLAYGLVGGGEIGDDGCALQGMFHRRSICHPEVLAYLAAHGKPMHSLAGKQDIGSERNRSALKNKGNRFRVALREMPSLIEFRVGGDIGLGYHPQNLPVPEYRGHIVKPALPLHGQTHHHQGVLSPGAFRDAQQLHRGLPQQDFLQE